MSSYDRFFLKNPALLDTKNKILHYIKNDPLTSQNILMKISDREIALIMLYMDKQEIETILSILSKKKIKRIKEELVYNKKLEIKAKLYSEITEKFISYFNTTNQTKTEKTYIKPKNKKE